MFFLEQGYVKIFVLLIINMCRCLEVIGYIKKICILYGKRGVQFKMYIKMQWEVVLGGLKLVVELGFVKIYKIKKNLIKLNIFSLFIKEKEFRNEKEFFLLVGSKNKNRRMGFVGWKVLFQSKGLFCEFLSLLRKMGFRQYGLGRMLRGY